ncbi:GntR family transcriptional regulator [Streptosporangium sp. NPDC002524]|uniref:GntR family transcriptional regulator n=1 Tax=Streptosporangium sp. NPDC002524 TaxID=3154537 RepID=UPI00331C18E4
MARWTGLPAYLQIANDYRGRIFDGALPPGAKLPSESEVMAEYEVSRIVARKAIEMLRNEGLIVSHTGKGSYVKQITRIVRDATTRYSRSARSASPFANDASRAGQGGGWDHESHRAKASAAVAERLMIASGDPVMVTAYLFRAGAEPVQLSTSYEPLEITAGTSVEYPEDGPVTGVIARMDTLGVHVDHVIERVTSRAARPEEAERLHLTQPSQVMVVSRTHHAGDRPVETCDIVVPGDRYELSYRIDVH